MTTPEGLQEENPKEEFPVPKWQDDLPEEVQKEMWEKRFMSQEIQVVKFTATTLKEKLDIPDTADNQYSDPRVRPFLQLELETALEVLRKRQNVE